MVPSGLTTTSHPPLADTPLLTRSTTSVAAALRLAHSSMVKSPFKWSEGESGTTTLPVEPSKLAAVSGDPAMAPAPPRVTPPEYVPAWPWPEESTAVVAPGFSPSFQYARGESSTTTLAY